MVNPQEVLSFWLDELSPKDWYAGGDALDTKVRDRFGAACEDVANGAYGLWLTYPSGTLAYLLLTDQFTRNIYRDTSRAFSLDKHARAAAKSAVKREWDLKIDYPARQFFYMPLMHSENLCDQDRAVRLIHTRIDDNTDEHLLHARAHREIIRQFGRFPFRNAALGRSSTAAELRFLKDGGYRTAVDAVSQAA